MRHLKLAIAAVAALTLFAVAAQAQSRSSMGPGARDYSPGQFMTQRDPTTREALDSGTF